MTGRFPFADIQPNSLPRATQAAPGSRAHDKIRGSGSGQDSNGGSKFNRDQSENMATNDPDYDNSNNNGDGDSEMKGNAAKAVSSYRSPSDVASPVTQKITALKTRKLNKSNLAQRSLFASTVSNQHLKHSTTSMPSSDTASGGLDSPSDVSIGSQSEGSMADDELDGGASDKSDDTVTSQRVRAAHEASRRRAGQTPALNAEDKVLDDGYLADESERN